MTLFYVFTALCLAHLAEHVAQVVQLYVYGMRMGDSRGLLGTWYPWLMHTEVLHWAYALMMLYGLYHFRNVFTGKARKWWMIATYIQAWHFFEHTLLFGQALAGHNFFGAATPISVIQFLGFFNGTPEDGFGGLLKMSHFGECDCPGAKPGTFHNWTPWLFVIRRPEVHMMYNLAVTIPMVLAMRIPYLEYRKKRSYEKALADHYQWMREHGAQDM